MEVRISFSRRRVTASTEARCTPTVIVGRSARRLPEIVPRFRRRREKLVVKNLTKNLIPVSILAAGLSTSLLAQNPAATIGVDANAGRHPISPLVYGVAYGEANLSDLNCPVNRYGGNNTSRYNWQINADNRGQDWYFESIAEPIATAGERGDTFIQKTKAAGRPGR